MDATRILMDEHRVIEQLLDALDTAISRLQSGEAIRPGFFLEVSSFIKGFADDCHHRKEEGVLFKAMEAHGVPAQGGPIGVMLAEHEMGRKFNQALRLAAQRLDYGDASAKAEIVRNAHGYTALLSQHIYKEDNILFPMADRVIPQDEQGAVSEGFERVEHEEIGQGIHEKYLALLAKLKQEVM